MTKNKILNKNKHGVQHAYSTVMKTHLKLHFLNNAVINRQNDCAELRGLKARSQRRKIR